MTIKAKRAQALRKMDHKEAASYGTGGWEDDSFPVDTVRHALTGAAIDLAAFDRFFGSRLARYRATLEWQQEQPPTAKELELLAEACEAIEQVRTRLAHLPPASKSHIQTVTWKRRKEHFQDFMRRLDVDLEEARTLLWLTERELEPSAGKTGRKSATLRDFLLHDVARWLNGNGVSGKTVASELAAAVLRALGIDAPEDPKEAARLVRAAEKQMEEIDGN